MKKLSELTISPAPWSFADDGIGEYDIRCSGVSYGEDYEGDDIIAQSVQKKDAPMLAAAPDMYEALWDLLFGDIGTVNCRKCKGAELGNCKTCHLGKAREAMEKACDMEVTHEETK